nr:hypothetical protein [Tanacetum cinerariifolium]
MTQISKEGCLVVVGYAKSILLKLNDFVSLSTMTDGRLCSVNLQLYQIKKIYGKKKKFVSNRGHLGVHVRTKEMNLIGKDV